MCVVYVIVRLIMYVVREFASACRKYLFIILSKETVKKKKSLLLKVYP